MENQYGITVANKYSLFLNEDEDPLEILKLHEGNKTATKKTDKSKKSTGAANEVDAKSGTTKQNVSAQEKKSEKIDQFSSPVQNDEKSTQNRPTDNKERKDRPRRSGEGREGQQQRNAGPRTGPGADGQRPPRNTDSNNRAERPPRRERQDRPGGNEQRERRFENREGTEQNQQQGGPEQTEHSGFEKREGFGNRPPRMERGGFRDRGARRGERFYRGGGGGGGFNNDRGGFADRQERSGFDDQQQQPEQRSRGFYGDRPPRRGGFRGRRAGEGFGGERTGFDNAENQEHGASEQPQQGNHDEVHQERGGFSDRQDQKGFDEQPQGERGGFDDRGGREFVRRGGRGGGRGFGGRGRPGRREFDRHTEGGMRPSDKRDGGGSHNWGTVNDELEGQQEKPVMAEGSTWAEQLDMEDRAAAAAKDAAPVEEDDKVMTLDEYKSIEEAKRVKAEFNIRKPGEGCSDPQWKKYVVLTKKEKEQEAHQEQEEDDEDDDGRHLRSKNVLNIDIRFADNPRRGGPGGGRGGGMGRGGRGGRGGPRGGGSDYRDYRGGERAERGYRSGGSHRERAPNVQDEMDFPSLDKAVSSGSQA